MGSLTTEPDLFGTTYEGGSSGNGTVWEIKAGSTTLTTLYSFIGTGTDGADPQSGVTVDPTTGDLVGTTTGGGSSSKGTVNELTVTCFCEGTLILSPAGEVPVAPGDLVQTADGKILPVRWFGRSTIATRFADPLRAAPIRIAAGALAENTPSRDFLVSPAHALFIDGLLVQAGALVNGSTIRQVPASIRLRLESARQAA